MHKIDHKFSALYLLIVCVYAKYDYNKDDNIHRNIKQGQVCPHVGQQ